MTMHRYFRITAILLAVCLLLSGCNIIGFDVENQLIPPQNDKEQNGMQAALYEYLQNNNFTLSYPLSGDYQTPFIVLDQIQKPVVVSSETTEAEETDSNAQTLSNWGLAFYRFNINNAKTKIHLLKKNEEGVWETAADIEGLSEDVAEVNFADLSGDGFPELLVGWNMYNTTDKRLAIYRIDRQLSAVPFENAYTAMRTAALTDGKAENIVLFNINSGSAEVKARLFSFVDSQMQLRGETLLDSGIKEFSSSLIAALSPTVNGIFVDCHKDANTTITELLYWNNDAFVSPLSHEQTNLNTETAREMVLSCRDIDGDGTVEWPVSERLPGYEHAPLESTLWRADWMSYDFRVAKAVYKFSSIANPTDAYMLRLRDEWTTEAVSFAYNSETNTLSIYREGEELPVLQLLATHSDTKIALPDGFSYFKGLNSWQYAAKVNADIITLEEVQYLFAVL